MERDELEKHMRGTRCFIGTGRHELIPERANEGHYDEAYACEDNLEEEA